MTDSPTTWPQLTPWQKLKLAVFQTALLTVASMVLAVPFGWLVSWYFQICWKMAAPQLFPGALEQGLITTDIAATSLWPVAWLLLVVVLFGRLEKSVDSLTNKQQQEE